MVSNSYIVKLLLNVTVFPYLNYGKKDINNKVLFDKLFTKEWVVYTKNPLGMPTAS